ncbi:MAG: Lsr2 family protein [Pseudonocardiales bacterium]|nr:Lsr2 family protein [Pseudonocardiales bacterium]
MAKTVQTIETVTDDLDGSSSKVSTVYLGFDGQDLELDLSDKNRKALEAALKPYVDAARVVKKLPGKKKPPTMTLKATNRATLAAMRIWAAETGLVVAARGRIAQSIQDAYHAATSH